MSGFEGLKAGLVSVTLDKHSPEEVIRLAVESGLAGIEWSGRSHAPAGDVAKAESIRAATSSAGLAISAYGSYYRLADFGGREVPEAEGFQASLSVACALGAPVMRVWAGEKGSAETSPEERSQLVERCREIADEAAAVGVEIAFEYHGETLTDTVDSTLRLLEEVGHENVSTYWQPSPRENSGEQRLVGLKRVLPWVRNVHCFHFGEFRWPDMSRLEQGWDEWNGFLDTLGSDGQTRWVSLEFVKGGTVEQYRKDAATLRGWLAG